MSTVEKTLQGMKEEIPVALVLGNDTDKLNPPKDSDQYRPNQDKVQGLYGPRWIPIAKDQKDQPTPFIKADGGVLATNVYDAEGSVVDIKACELPLRVGRH